MLIVPPCTVLHGVLFYVCRFFSMASICDAKSGYLQWVKVSKDKPVPPPAKGGLGGGGLSFG